MSALDIEFDMPRWTSFEGQAEKLGFTRVWDFEYSDLNWQFDTQIIWRRNETGEYYGYRDSGCSCPIPFEDIHRLSDLTHVDQQYIIETLRDVSKCQRDAEDFPNRHAKTTELLKIGASL